jgi:hypothetical protein
MDEDYQDAAEQLIGADDLFDDVEAEAIDEVFDFDLAVEQLYNAVYG